MGLAGMALSVLAGVAGLRLVNQAGATLSASADVAAESLAAAERSLAEVESTTHELQVVLAEAEALLASTADLSEQEVAGSIQAVEEALPALIEVAAVIDRTLSTLAALPFGPPYNPEEPFDRSLQRVQQELEGLPADLRAQAGLVRDAGTGLAAARASIVAVGEDLGELQTALRSAADLLAGFSGGSETVTELDLRQRLRSARLLVVALAGTAALAHLAPLLIGWLMLGWAGWPSRSDDEDRHTGTATGLSRRPGPPPRA